MAASPVQLSASDSLAERIRQEEEAILASVRRTAEENDRQEARLAEISGQNEALAALVREQEAYLLDVEAQIKRIQQQRSKWRRRYAEVTGTPLDEPVAAGS